MNARNLFHKGQPVWLFTSLVKYLAGAYTTKTQMHLVDILQLQILSSKSISTYVNYHYQFFNSSME